MAMLTLLMPLVVSQAIAIALDTSKLNQGVTTAIEEMQRASYFTFVMLINMAPVDLVQGNITFFMPNDRTLANARMNENAVVDFLLGHSIPSPLLMEHLQHFPTGSLIPTSRPGFVLRITNDGRSRFFLNNVRIISPNICTRVASIRCHGIDGVIQATSIVPDPNVTPLICLKNNTHGHSQVVAAPPSPEPSALIPVKAPPPADSNETLPGSNSSQINSARVLDLVIITSFMLFCLSTS